MVTYYLLFGVVLIVWVLVVVVRGACSVEGVRNPKKKSLDRREVSSRYTQIYLEIDGDIE